jgi:glycosidase
MDQLFIKFGADIFTRKQFPTFEFHIAKEVRKKYEFDELLFSINGNVVFANFAAVREFVQKYNLQKENKDKVGAGQVNAVGLLDEIYHYIFRLYEVQVNPGVFSKALASLNNSLGEDKTRKLLFDFVARFPPVDVYKGKIEAYDYLNSYTADRSNAEITLEEMILLYFANFNPANKKLKELFNQDYLENGILFEQAIGKLEQFFREEKKFGPDNQDMFTLFKTPILNNPDNIEAQLQFITEKWKILLDENFLRKILSSGDLIKEDYRFESFGGGSAPTAAPGYKPGMTSEHLTLGKSGYKYAVESWKDYIEPENFTKDIDWMPRVVLMAKNAYVWLDQLSKKYRRHIKTLDQVPEEELDQLASWGFNGLWLIGIWERSSASKKIKHIMGNIDAVASAYSLYDYEIAYDLGGEFAYQNLNERAKAKGIRLASDMVPNHTGIYSKWMKDNPDFFVQAPNPPFPNYTFLGENLSEDPGYQVRIEDGYYRKSDAAVVFQRIDNRNGEVSYIYHGNDGTNMPWNDTAQLNMIIKEVREAVIQKIFDVARKFSIIRFDAAMTLAKRHFSRLWYPEPGRGGDIPSRADYSMTKEEFDAVFPEEFWREVVDRINSEMPETLLLAEAFWMMEGYFVRSLGMHRVYNSAFMHMMMKEENEKYRDAISNTLEFEPEILKRYVNFMSNPDEETAIKQFGTDDKYFGVCTVMVTLPGLPMFGHGQIEGFTEKYGMEYQRAYYHETPHQWLIERHEREIFPLVKKRYLFSQVANFWLFDFINSYGNIDENVFAYTNMEYGERSIVFYNNKYNHTGGSINRSTPKLVSRNDGSKQTETRSVAGALNMKGVDNCFYIFREHVANLEYIRSGKDFHSFGLSVDLDAFKTKVFLNFHEIIDLTGDYKLLADSLNGAGVPSVHEALIAMKLQPVHNAFEDLFNPETMEGFVEAIMINDHNKDKESIIINFLDEEYRLFLDAVQKHFGVKYDTKPVIKDFEDEIHSTHRLNQFLTDEFSIERNPKNGALHKSVVVSSEVNYRENSLLFLMWLSIFNLRKLLNGNPELNKENFLEKMLLDLPVKRTLKRIGKSEQDLYFDISLLNVLIEFADTAFNVKKDILNSREENKLYNHPVLAGMLNDERVKILLGVNEYEGIIYFSKENFEEMINWMFSISLVDLIKKEPDDEKWEEQIVHLFEMCEYLKNSSKIAGYKLELLIELLKEYPGNEEPAV